MDLQVIDEIMASNAFPSYKSYCELIKATVETNPAVAYWSVIHIVDGLMRQQSTLGDKKRYLNDLVVLCENIRAHYKEHLSFSNAHKSIEDYANEIFLRANDEQELGVSYQTAVKLFLLSAATYQVLITQSPTDDHEQTKKVIKLAKMKAVETAKLLKQAANAPPSESQETKQNNDHEDFIASAPKDEDLHDDFLFQPTPQDPSAEPEEFSQPAPRKKLAKNTSRPHITTPVEPNLSKETLSETDRRRAELFTESALFALQEGDIDNATTGLKMSLKILEKFAFRQHPH